MGIIDKISDWIKLPVTYLFAIALFCGFLLFANNDVLGYFDLKNLQVSFKPWISFVFIASSALLVTHSLVSIIKFIKHQINKRVWIIQGKRRLHYLNLDEKRLLRSYIVENTHTQYLSLASGVVHALESEFIIYQAANMGRLHTFAYNIHPWAWRYLRKHPELIAGAEDSSEPLLGSQRRKY